MYLPQITTLNCNSIYFDYTESPASNPGVERHLHTQVPYQVSHNSNLNNNIDVNTLKSPYVRLTVNKVKSFLL